MKVKMSLVLLSFVLSLNSFAAQRLDRLMISTPQMKLSDHKTETVSLEELKRLLMKLSINNEARPEVKGILVEGTVMSPPSRGMAPTQQNAHLLISSEKLGLKKTVSLKPDTYNRIEIPLEKGISSETVASELQLEAASLGLIGELKISFIIDYN